jgi:phospholipid/cholesterol/gamma-HCH transport system substrate-binding protein
MAAEDSRQGEARQSRRTLYGILIIAGIFGLGLFVFFLEDIIGLFERRYEIVALVPDAPGVASGTPVWVGGKRVGRVTSVAILPSSVDTMGRVAVVLKLPRHVQPQIRADSRVRLTSVSMISEAAIDVLPGSAGERVLLEGDTLGTDPRQSAAELTARAAAVRAELDTVLVAVRELTPRLQQRLSDTQRAFAGMDGAMMEAQRLRADIQANPGVALLRDPAFQRSLSQARSHADALPAAITQLRERAGQGSEVAAALARLQLRADSVGAQLAAAAAMIEEQQGTLGRMQHDTAIVRAVNAARASLDSLIAEVRGNPLRFVF